mgnify:CR=1 FL=1
MSLLQKDHSICVAGSNGMVGKSICKLLQKEGYSFQKKNLFKLTREDLDLSNFSKVKNWFYISRPDVVIISAAKVGGIMANKKKPVDFLLENLKIQNNLIENSFNFGVKRLLFLGSSCIYPKFCKQPIKENYLLSDHLESTNQWYAVAKIAGLKLCEAYRRQYNFDAISLMPTNLYGPGDNYDLKNSHVMPALIRKFYEAKKNNLDTVTCWGSGKPLREFLYVEDLAEACLFALKHWNPNKNICAFDNDGSPLNWMNIGSGEEISIKNLAQLIADIIDFQGEIIWDSKMPDGTPRKKLDTELSNKLGWFPKTKIEDGIKKTIDFYINEKKY